MNIKKIIEEAHIPNYAHPSLEDTSYVLLSLALGVIKRNVYELVLFNSFSDETEKDIVNKGVKMINGDLSIDSYIKELEKTLKKESNKDFKFDDSLVNQIKMRLEPTIDQTTKKLDLTKETGKSVKKDGTLKESNVIVNDKKEDLERSLTKPTEADKKALSEDNTTESRIDPRFLALPEKDRVIVLKAIGELRLPFDGVVTKQIIDKVVQGFKKHYNKQSQQMQYIIDTLLVSLDPSNYKKYTAKDKEVFLNSESKTDKISPEELQALIKFASDNDLNLNKVKREWKASKHNYNNVSDYIKQVESNQDFEFLEPEDKEELEEANVLEPQSKDYMRIRDIFDKTSSIPQPQRRYKIVQLAQLMANKITDSSKAYRRYKAAEDENAHELALIFYKRFRDLEK